MRVKAFKVFLVCILVFTMVSTFFVRMTAYAGTATVTISTGTVTNSNFKGFGSQFDPFALSNDGYNGTVTALDVTNIFAKRWNEIKPSFTRVYIAATWWEPTEGTKTWNSTYMNALYKVLDICQANGTEVWLNQWHNRTDGQNVPNWLGGGVEITDTIIQQKFARTTVDCLDYLINTKGYTNIKYYCLANELQAGNGAMTLAGFKNYNQKIYNEMGNRGKVGLVGLVGADQSWNEGPFDGISWCADNMDNITAIYSGHSYINGLSQGYDNKPRFDTGLGYTKPKSKPFYVGEFGCAYNGEHDEKTHPGVGIFLGEASVAGLNAGVDGMSQWSFTSGNYHLGTYWIGWGLFAAQTQGYAIRPSYYAYGLLTKYFRSNSKSFGTTSSDSNIRTGAVKSNVDGKYSIAVVNKNITDTTVTYSISGDAINTTFRKYIYNPSSLPVDNGGYLQPSSGNVTVTNGSFTDTVPAGAMVVYTNRTELTGGDTNPPPPPPVLGSNLALNKTIVASNYFQNNATYNGAKAVDGSVASRWATDNVTTAWMEVDFPVNTTFNATRLKECIDYGQRIKTYEIQYWNGASWVNAYSGEDPASTQLDTFPSVTSNKVRLNISSVNAAGPTVWEFEVYNATGVELLENPSFNSDSTNWTNNGGQISMDTTQYNSYPASCKGYSRTANWNGPYQDITSSVIANGQGNYTASLKMKLANGSDTGKIQIGLNYGGSWHYIDAIGAVNSSGWSTVGGTVNLTWTGTLTEARYYVNTASTTGDIYVDDCSLKKQ